MSARGVTGSAAPAQSPAARRPVVGLLASTTFTVGTKALQAVASFATVHQLVRLWELSGYGLWVTLTAFALYISLFDMGVGYGVKNRISEAWGRGDPDAAVDVLRGGVGLYFMSSLIALAGGVLLIGLVVPFKDHVVAAAILWVACVGSFFLSFHRIVLQGLGRFKLLALLGLIAPVAWFAVLQAWPKDVAMPLAVGAAIYSAALLAQAGVTVACSRRVHAYVLVGWHRLAWRQAAPLLRTGAQFLALQLASFALYSCGSFVIYRTLGAAETAQYDAANKVFSIFTVAFSTLISIAWTEISRAKAVEDHRRMRRIHRLLHLVAFGLLLAALGASQASASLTKALTGISVPTSQTLAFVVLVAVQMLAFTSAVFLNAFERLRAQIIAAIVSVPIFFAVAFALLAAGEGMPSIPLASAVAQLPSLLVCFLIARRLVAGMAGGVDAAAPPSPAQASGPQG